MFLRRKARPGTSLGELTETDSQRQMRAAFNAIGWHDSQLLRFATVEDDSAGLSRVEIDVSLIEHEYRKTSQVTFEDCFVASFFLDFAAKRACSHQINDGRALFNSDLKEQVKSREVPRLELLSLSEYLHFEFDLIRPSGKIMILARNFVFQSRNARSQ